MSEPVESPAEDARPASPRLSLGEQPAVFFTAVRFLTRIPVPEWFVSSRVGIESAALVRASLVYFPLVGSLIGLATAFVILGAGQVWNAWLAVLIGLAFEAVVTGAFHEDAVADFCDAFGGGWTREDVLRLLKDSRVGSFGALGLMLAVLLRAGGIFSLEPDQLLPATIASATLGRLVILVVMAMLPPVQDRPGLARELGKRLTAKELALGVLFALPGTAWMVLVAPYAFAAAMAALLVLVFVFAGYVGRRLGGVTGDCLGCVCYLGQIVVLLAAAARVSGLK